MVHFYRIARTDENHAQPVLYIHTNKQTVKRSLNFRDSTNYSLVMKISPMA